MVQSKYGERGCFEALAGMVLPPVMLCCCSKQTNYYDVVICLLLMFFGILPGSLYAFWKTGMPCCTVLLCWFLPPIAMCCEHGCCYETMICLLLTLTLPGASWYAFANI